MKSVKNPYVTLVFVAVGLSARADVLELKNGNVLNGKYAVGTTATVRFETSAGVRVMETSQIIALTFHYASLGGIRPGCRPRGRAGHSNAEIGHLAGRHHAPRTHGCPNLDASAQRFARTI